MKQLSSLLCALCLCSILICSLLLLLPLQPSQDAAAAQKSIPKDDTLFSFSALDLDRIYFTKNEESFCLINLGDRFVLEGYESLLLNTDSLMTLLESFPSASLSEEEITSADIQIEILSTHSKPFTLSLQEIQQRILLYNEEQTYFYPAGILDPLLSSPEDFIDRTVISSEFPQQASLTLSGSLHAEALQLSYYIEEQRVNSFCGGEEITSQQSLPLLQSLCDLRADQIMLLDPSDEDLRRLGLDDPFLSLDAQLDEEQHSFHFSEAQTNGRIYFIKEDTPLLYSASAQQLPFLSATKETILELSLFQADYDDTTNLTVVSDELSCQFTKWDGQVLCQGKFVDEEQFYDFYRLCTTLIPQEALILSPSEERSLLRLEFSYTNPQRHPDFIEFFSYDERFVLLSINNESGYLLKKSLVEEILSTSLLLLE